MRFFALGGLCLLVSMAVCAQPLSHVAVTAGDKAVSENIYEIKKQFLYNVLHNPAEREEGEDNELARFNRWFHDAEIRCYPSGNLPRPDVLVNELWRMDHSTAKAQRQTSGAASWQPVGPMKVPFNSSGIGRVNCIIIDPIDTNTLYIGAACGGVYISHDGGNTWTSNSDNFPSLSIADIAVNPRHTDTIYAATGDGYGYEEGYSIFWGGLYSAGIMKSTDGGHTWNTTGLSYLQTNREIVQKLLVHPVNPNILLAATRHGIFRSTDAGATWSNVESGHVYSMAFKPFGPDTVYAVNTSDLRVSYNAGATWQTVYTGINPTSDRCSIAVSPKAPNAIWALDANNDLQWSHNGGHTFYTTASPSDTARFYGYYDRVLAVSPADSNYVLAFGMIMAKSVNGGASWSKLDLPGVVHPDNHAVAINLQHSNTIYTGNDGGISVTRDGGHTWRNLSNGLMISQIYRMAVSKQNPKISLCGLQDNGTVSQRDSAWRGVTGGDGEACAIHPANDYLQISSSQYGWFNMSFDQGGAFTHLNITSETGNWTSPVAFDPHNELTAYFGYKNIYATYDQGSTFVALTTGSPFPGGAIYLNVAPSDGHVIYAADFSHIMRTTDGGTSWVNVTGTLPAASVAISRLAVDHADPMRIYAVMSGYSTGVKVFYSTTGGSTWTNISSNLPNLPVDCIAIDSSTPGALFVGTDIGVYYTDSSQTGWTLYSTGLPNVIVNDLDVSYVDYKVRAATYGRGVWVNDLKKPAPSAVHNVVKQISDIQLYPNPATESWNIRFAQQKPSDFTVRLTDINGRLLQTMNNTTIVDASKLAAGVYNIEVISGEKHSLLKAIRR